LLLPLPVISASFCSRRLISSKSFLVEPLAKLTTSPATAPTTPPLPAALIFLNFGLAALALAFI
jgi:hypothetical protein